MPTLLLPRPVRGNRPSGPFTLNRANPLTRGLQRFLPLAGSLQDLVKSDFATAVNGSFLRGAMQGGQALTCASANTQYATVPLVDIGGTWAVAFWVLRNGNRNYDAGFTSTTTNQPNPFDIYCPVSGVWQFFYGPGSVAGTLTATSVTGPGVWELVVAQHNAGGSSLALQGLTRATGAATAMSWATTGYIGSRADNVTLLNGQIHSVGLWNRQLSDADVWALYEPSTRWGLYQVPSTRVYVDLSTPPPPATRGYRLALMGVA